MSLAAALLVSAQSISGHFPSPAIAKAPDKTDSGLQIQHLHESAINAYHAFDYAKALKTYKELLGLASDGTDQHVKFATAAGASAFHLGRYHDALKYYSQAGNELSKLAAKSRPNYELYAEIICSKGETIYEIGDYKKSAAQFLIAIDLWKEKKASDDILMRSLEGLGASYFHAAQYAQALPVYQELAWRDGQTLGPESLQYGWSLRILSDVYKALGEESNRTACRERSTWIFRLWNKNKQLAEHSGLIGPKLTREELILKLDERLIGGLNCNQDLSFIKPAAYTHIPDRGGSVAYDPVARRKTMVPWERHRIVMSDPAGVQWTDPLVPMIGVIICVPGFGLQHGSFDEFGKRMAKVGYLVVSYDVRGFGAYTALKARHRIDLLRTLDDLTTSATLLNKEFPKLPIFILGESMGGSVALQFVAFHGDLVDGLIAAVPSAQRSDGWLADIKIGLDLLASPDQVANLESYLVNRVTTNDGLREKWEHDPESRFTITSAELDAYQSFLKRNDKCAKMITRTPVIIFQGLNDLLIRPEGAIKLVREITSPDKDLILIGKSQHLLFEQGQFNDDIISQVSNWMRMHARSEKDFHN